MTPSLPPVIKLDYLQLTDIQIQFWILISAIVGFIAAYCQLKQNLITRRTQLLHDMFSQLSQLHLKILELVGDITKSGNGDNKGEHKEEYKVIVNEYLNFLEHLSLLINTKHIDEKLAKRAFRRIVIKDAPEHFAEEIDDSIHKEYAMLRKKWIEDETKGISCVMGMLREIIKIFILIIIAMILYAYKVKISGH